MTDAVAAPEAPAKTDSAPTAANNKGVEAAGSLLGGEAPAEGKTLLDGGEAPKDAPVAKQQSKAPEKYDTFKLPEGLTLDPVMSDEFVGVAKKLDLSQADAQVLVDLQAKYVQEQQKAVMTNYQRTVEEWKKASIQALGAEYKTEIGVAAKALERFGSPELRQLLNETGLGNHPEMIKFALKIGKAVSEDGFVEGKRTDGSAKSAAEVLYGKSK